MLVPRSVSPDIIYFNAGTDILEDDPLNGGVRISREGVAKRDAFVFNAAFTRKIPIVFVLRCAAFPRKTNGYSSTYLAMVLANVRAGTRYPPEYERIP